MFTSEQKQLAQELLLHHKKGSGIMSYNAPSKFKDNPLISVVVNKLVAIGLLYHHIPGNTSFTSLSQKGWEFTSFETLELQLIRLLEVDRLAIEKLEQEVNTLKRQAKVFWPVTIVTLSTGIATILSFLLKTIFGL